MWDVSRVVLQLNGGERERIRNGFAGAWTGKDGVAHASALHNCFTDASWFAPLLILEAAATDPAVSVTLSNGDSASPANSHSRASGNLSTSNIGETPMPPSPGNRGNPGIVLSRIVPNQSAAITTEFQKFSTEMLYLDASTLLPVELDFNVHPDNDGNRDIPVEIQFSDYRPVNGALIPFHIQKFIQHSLLLDLEVTAASVNSGIAASDFALPAIVPLAAPVSGAGGNHENHERPATLSAVALAKAGAWVPACAGTTADSRFRGNNSGAAQLVAPACNR